MKRSAKLLSAALAICLLAGCRPGLAPMRAAETDYSVTESPSPEVLPRETETSLPAKAQIPDSFFWNDVVEIVNRAGETTTVYKLDDGRYMDRIDRIFLYDGDENWICSDGSEWNRTLSDCEKENATTVYAEFVIERFLAQRPDHKYFSDAADNPYAARILLTFSSRVTNFRFLKIDAEASDDGRILYRSFQELYTRDTLTEDDLMVVETELGEVLPIRGFSFTDASGNTRYYYLALSGEDNVPLAIRITG